MVVYLSPLGTLRDATSKSIPVPHLRLSASLKDRIPFVTMDLINNPHPKHKTIEKWIQFLNASNDSIQKILRRHALLKLSIYICQLVSFAPYISFHDTIICWSELSVPINSAIMKRSSPDPDWCCTVVSLLCTRMRQSLPGRVQTDTSQLITVSPKPIANVSVSFKITFKLGRGGNPCDKSSALRLLTLAVLLSRSLLGKASPLCLIRNALYT
jgi:hypothetical protein